MQFEFYVKKKAFQFPERLVVAGTGLEPATFGL